MSPAQQPDLDIRVDLPPLVRAVPLNALADLCNLKMPNEILSRVAPLAAWGAFMLPCVHASPQFLWVGF